jgi:hypothetical protein
VDVFPDVEDVRRDLMLNHVRATSANRFGRSSRRRRLLPRAAGRRFYPACFPNVSPGGLGEQ